MRPSAPLPTALRPLTQRYFSKSPLRVTTSSPPPWLASCSPKSVRSPRSRMQHGLAAMLRAERHHAGRSTTRASTTIDSMLHPTVSSEGCSGAESSRPTSATTRLGSVPWRDPTFGETRTERERMLKTSRSARWIPRCKRLLLAIYNSRRRCLSLNDALVSLDPTLGPRLTWPI